MTSPPLSRFDLRAGVSTKWVSVFLCLAHTRVVGIGRTWTWGLLLVAASNLANAAQLIMSDGVVVKFGSNAGLVARDRIATEGTVVLTSLNDASVGGATIMGGPAATPGDWRGVAIEPGAYVADIELDGIDIRYAGGSGGAGLSFGRLPFDLDQISVSQCTIGVRAVQGGTALLNGMRLYNNGVGLRVEGNATPLVTDSEIVGSSVLGVDNATPSTVVIATGNWWGHPSGPLDPIGNPSGQGNGVSAGVDYGQFLPGVPLVNCSVRASNGQYAVIRRDVSLGLACRNATEYRLAESTNFGAAPFVPMAASATFTLSAGGGTKPVYAQFRGSQGQIRTVATPEPFIYSPTSPVVALLAPPAGAVLTANTEIRASATDPIGITQVEFRYGTTTIGIDDSEPYELTWDISTAPDGIHVLSAIATNTEGRTGIGTRTIALQRVEPQPDAYAFDEGEVLFVDTPGVLANDSVASPQGLDVQQVDAPAWGTLHLEDDGSFVFQPDTPDRNGTTTFRYRLVSNGITSATVAVTLTVRPVNDTPSPGNDSYLTDENVQVTVSAPGLLGNDTDVDSTTLQAQPQTAPSHGEVVIQPDGAFSYVPAVNYRGIDTFEYRAVDEQGGSTTATATVIVTQPPTATNDVYLVDQDTPLIITEEDDGLVANDHDAPENDELAAVLSRDPDHGAIVLQSDGTFSYSPDLGFVGLDTVRYQVSDGRSLSNVAVVTLAVGITNLPRAFPDDYTLTEDQELIVPAADGLLANDLDADTPLADLRPTVVGISEYGIQASSLVLQPDGGFRVRPGTDFVGETFFVYQLFDGTSVSNAAIVTLTVEPVNDGVDAEDDVFGVIRNTVFQSGVGYHYGQSIEVNDEHDPDFEVNYAVVSPPAFGILELDPATGATRYTPQRDFSGSDTYTYRLSQVATGISDTATVTFRVNGPPVAVADAYTIDEDSVAVVTPSLLVNDYDPDGDTVALAGTGFTDGYGIAYINVDDAVNPTTTTLSVGGHFHGPHALYYLVTDGTASVYGLISLTILPVPDDPIVAADEYLVQQNTTLQVSAAQGVLHNDYDPDTSLYPGGPIRPGATGSDLIPIVPELIATTSHGNLVFAADGSFIYTPNTNYSGTDTFSYRVVDGTGRSATAHANIRVNSPAQAVDDAYFGTEDAVLVITPEQGLIANDVDIDGDALSVGFVPSGCHPCHGTLLLRLDGGFRYTPDLNYNGPDEFYYRVVDAVAGPGVGHVSLTILPVNDAPVTEPDTYRTAEDVVLQALEPQGLLRNDREVDGEALTDAQLLLPPTHGAVVVSALGGFSYTPDVNFNGRDTFRYRVFDQSNLHTDEDVEVIVTAVNDAPAALNDNYQVDRDRALTVPAATGVLANDTDVDGPSLGAAVVGPPAHGQFSLAANGSFNYQPDGVFVGIDQFQYQVDDGLGAVDLAIATINVRDVTSPVQITVADDFYAFVGPGLSVPAPGVLANDSVTGASGLSAGLVVAPQTGNVVVSADGGFTYSAPPGFSGSVSFSYSASAGASSELALVTLEVQSTTNVPPVAVGEQFGVLEDGLLDSRSSGGLLANDSDFEGATLTLQLLTPPAHGALDAQADGQFTYRPAANYQGSDQFTYRVSDGTQSSNAATAAITVFAQNDPPTAVDDAYQTLRGQTLTVSVASGVLANDSDPDGDPISLELVDAPIYGQVHAAANGSFSYQPQSGHAGADQFRYAASDGAARSVARVSINVTLPGNQPPTAQGETLILDEDGVISSANAGLLTANDSDPDGDAMIVALVNPPTHGTLDLDGAAFTYRPQPDYFGPDQFTYTVSDGALTAGPVAAQITVNAINDAPRPQTDVYLVLQGQTLNVAASNGVLANDVDVEGQTLSTSVETPPGHGSLSLAANGGFVYQPDANFHGRDEFGYRVSDGSAFAVGRAVIDVTRAVNQRPVAIGEVFAIPEDSMLDTRNLQSLLANDVDADGQPLTLVILTQPPRGQLEDLGAGHVRYTPVRDDTGTVSFDYTVSDVELQALPVQVEIILQPRNDAPQAVADLYALPPTQTALTLGPSLGVLANDLEPDGDTLLVSVVQAPASGTLNLSLDGSFLYTPANPRPASVGFIYRVTDPAGLSAQAPVQILLGGEPPGEIVFKSGFEANAR